jgi:hypothetical protein
MPSLYNTNAEIAERCKQSGYVFFADDDLDGAVGVTDAATNVTTANTWAGALVDEAICEFIDTADARGSQNDWLKGRHLDLAVYRLSTMGGSEEIGSLKVAFDDSKDALERVRGGQKVPGLVYTNAVTNALRSHRFPFAVNP